MKLHYVALRKDMFLIHGHFLYTNFEVKGFFFFFFKGWEGCRHCPMV